MLKTSNLIGCLVMSINVFAAPVCNSSWGQLNCNKGCVDKINAQGIVSLHETIVSGASKVHGTFNANNVSLNTLNTKGMSTIKSSTINGVSEFIGGLKAKNCNFKENIYITSDSIDLESCQAKKLIINKNDDLTSTIKLHGNTVVQKVVFKQDGGEVWLYDNAKVLEPIIGGKIINK